jgi:predicted enzyme related to lactoylglutathione lyase
VASVDDSVERATALGGSNVVPKKGIPGVGWLAYSKDTEGNIFGMMQNDPSAK